MSENEVNDRFDRMRDDAVRHYHWRRFDLEVWFRRELEVIEMGRVAELARRARPTMPPTIIKTRWGALFG